MAVRTQKDLKQALKQGKIEPVYFLFGPESFLRNDAAREIANAALSDTLLREFNDSVFSLAGGDVRSAIAAAEQLPMMSSRRVVRIKDFAKLPEAEEETLLSYLTRPVESSVVIFIADDIDKRKKLARTLMTGAAFEFQPLKMPELTAWTRARLKELKTEIEPQALQRLIEIVASDLNTLANELGKLAAAAMPSGLITSDLINALSIRSREHQNYELTDHLLSRNGRGALRTLKDLLDDGVEPLMLIGLIAGTYRRLALARELLARGASQGEIFSEIRMPPFKQRDYLSIVSRFDSGTLARRIKRIAAADLAIKTSKATPRMQVEMLVCELTS